MSFPLPTSQVAGHQPQPHGWSRLYLVSLGVDPAGARMTDGMICHNRNCAYFLAAERIEFPTFVGRRPNEYDVLSTLTLPVQRE
jgi:hypothetical protein